MPASIRSARIAAPIAAILALLVGLLATAPPAGASHDVTPARIEGDTRYATAAEIALLDHPQGSGVVLLANGNRFPDALAATPYARPTAAPILLTEEDDLPTVTAQTLQDLGAQQVVIIGGTSSVSQAVADELADQYEVDRVAGDTRFETAAAIANRIRLSPNAQIGELDGLRTAVLVNAFAFADAVSAGPFAAGQANPFPILLTEETQLTDITRQALADLAIEQVVIVGGEAVIDAGVEQRLQELGYDTHRVAGENRSDTSTQVAALAVLSLGFDVSTVNISRGDEFADALAAGPFAGRAQAPILLTPEPSILGSSVEAYLRRSCPEVSVVRAIGGQQAITTATLEAAEQAAEACHAQTEQAEQTFIVSPQEPVTATQGTTLEAEVGARYDDQPFTGPVNVAIVPCAEADVTGSGQDTFDDSDGNGVADGFQTSDTGSAAIVSVNGAAVQATGQVVGVGPDADGTLQVGVRAEDPDCVVVVVYADQNGDDLFDVTSAGVPLEPYGVTKFTWTA